MIALIAGLLFAAGFLLGAASAFAWDDTGHAAVGVLAVEQTAPATQLTLEDLLGSHRPDDIAEACNWADGYRGTPEGEWSAPLHYVNIDPASNHYRRRRDCPDGACVVEAVARYAERLGDAGLAAEDRREAFRFLCHFAGDLHQPLHVGYADDRGGNLVTIDLNGETMNLHAFWDHALPERHADGWPGLVVLLRQRPNPPARGWNASELLAWTNETFSITRNFAYPRTRDVDPVFERRSWQVALQQMDMAAVRLAAILDAELGGAGRKAAGAGTAADEPEP